MLSNEEKQNGEIWFEAKRYGLGWGFPCHRNGWVVVGVYLLFVVLVCFVMAAGSMNSGTLIVLLSSAIYIAFNFWKGTPLKWRWGNDDQS